MSPPPPPPAPPRSQERAAVELSRATSLIVLVGDGARGSCAGKGTPGPWTRSPFIFRINKSFPLIRFPNRVTRGDAFGTRGHINGGFNPKDSYSRGRNLDGGGPRGWRLSSDVRLLNSLLLPWPASHSASSVPAVHSGLGVAASPQPWSSRGPCEAAAASSAGTAWEGNLSRKSGTAVFCGYGQSEVRWQPLTQSLAPSIGVWSDTARPGQSRACGPGSGCCSVSNVYRSMTIGYFSDAGPTVT